jgi:hypothetical protein
MSVSYFDHSHLPPSLQAALDKQLDDGEVMVWTDQPHAGQLIARGMKGVLLPLALGFFGLTQLFHNVRNLDIGMFFFALGLLGAITSPFFLYRRVKRMAYVLTNKRAMIISGTAKAVQVQSFLPKDLQALSVKQNADGTGDIVFGSAAGPLWDPKTMNEAAPRSKKKRLISPGFYGVKEAKRVESLLRALASSVDPVATSETVPGNSGG